jgi:hypothetical protein
MRKTISRSPRSMASNRSPVEASKWGMSIAASGSVQRTSSRSPGAKDFRALPVLSAGRGHFSPDRSNLAMVTAQHRRMALSRLWFDNLRRRSPPTLTRTQTPGSRPAARWRSPCSLRCSLDWPSRLNRPTSLSVVCLRSDRASYSVGSRAFRCRRNAEVRHERRLSAALMTAVFSGGPAPSLRASVSSVDRPSGERGW